MPRLPRHMRRRAKDVIYVRLIDGKERSTRSTDVEVAKALKRDWDREAADPDYKATQAYTLSTAVADFEKHLAARVRAGELAQATEAFYIEKLGHVVRVFESTLPRDAECTACDEDGICSTHYAPRRLATMGTDACDHYIAERRTDGVKDTTIKKELVPFVLVLRMAKRARRWRGDLDTFIPVDFSPRYVPRSRHLEHAEFQKLVTELIPAHAAQVAFAIATSAELGAINRAQRADIADKQVLVRGSKNANRWRTVPVIAEWQRAMLAFVLKHANGKPPLLFRPWHSDHRGLSGACGRAKIEPCSFNDLRRTFAHWMRRDRVLLEHIAPMMGHATTTMLQRVYGKLTAQELQELLTERAAPVPGTRRTSADKSDGRKKEMQQNQRSRRGQRDSNPRPSDSKSVGFFIPEPRRDGAFRKTAKDGAAPVPRKKGLR